jgi:hypothetical protein
MIFFFFFFFFQCALQQPLLSPQVLFSVFLRTKLHSRSPLCIKRCSTACRRYMCTPQTTSLSLCASNSTTSLPLSIYLYLTPRAPLGMNLAIKPKRQQEVLDLPITNTKQNKNKSLQHRISFSERERERERVQARLLHSLYKHHFLRSPESKLASLLVLQEAATMKLLHTKKSPELTGIFFVS